MIYHLKSSRQNRRFTPIIFGVVLLLVVVILGGVVSKFLGASFVSVFTPLNVAGQKISDGSKFFVSFFEPKKNLISERDQLLLEVSRLRLEHLEFLRVKADYENVLSAYGRENSKNAILAGVVALPDKSPFDTILIDAGSDLGVKVGDFVLGHGGVNLGKVSDVFQSQSRVRLYSYPGDKMDAYIGESKIQAVAMGLGGGSFEIRLPKGADVYVGDQVVVPGIRSEAYGVVEEIESTEDETFQRILFKNPFSFNELRVVEVVSRN